MSIVGGILIYVNLWMIVLFTVLPLGVKNQIDSPDFQKGTDPGAPIESKMKRKVLIKYKHSYPHFLRPHY